jgi:hypothetical protein
MIFMTAKARSIKLDNQDLDQPEQKARLITKMIGGKKKKRLETWLKQK